MSRHRERGSSFQLPDLTGLKPMWSFPTARDANLTVDGFVYDEKSPRRANTLWDPKTQEFVVLVEPKPQHPLT